MAIPELPDRVALTQALGALGLPEPTGIGTVGRSWRHRMWRVEFAEASGAKQVLVRAPVHPEVGDTLSPEIAALTLAGRAGLPVVPRYHRIQGLGFPAAVSEILPGLTGDQILQGMPDKGAEVIRAVGRVAQRLAALRQPNFGTAAIGNRFVPTRSSWGESWRARVDQLVRHTAAGGDLGALSRALEQGIADRLPALAGVMDFSLVHGDLQPGNLLFTEGPDGAPVLSGVIDWESAMAGDPLVEWALFPLVPDGTLGHVLEGYGIDHARVALGEPGAFERIELYWLSHILERLAFAAGPHLEADPVRRNGALQRAAGLWRAFADGPGAKVRIEAALEQGGSSTQGLPQPRLEQVLRQGMVDALSRGAIRDPADAWTLVGAARAVELSEASPMGRAAWLETAIGLVDRLESGRVRLGPPIADLAAFRDKISSRALMGQMARDGGPGTVLALVATVLDLDRRLDGTVPDAAWRGLETAVHGMLALGAGWREGARVSEPVRLAHGVMGLAALRSLEGALGAGERDPGLVAVRTTFAGQTGRAWEAVGAEPTAGDLLELLDQGPPTVTAGAEPALTPAICGALHLLESAAALPVPAVAIARVLGLGSAA